jgi:uncharacterized protein (DUF1800 family)
MRSIESAIAANRFGLGARAGDAASIGDDPRGWLLEQLADANPGPISRPLASATTFAEISELQLARQRQNRARARATARGDGEGAQRPSDAGQDTAIKPDAIREYRQFIARNYREQVAARYRSALETEQPFVERLVRFWGNHFAISADKQPVGAFAFDYENEAIRPHITGNFRQMLTAVEKHPAMLFYLDNQTSIGPNSAAATAVRRNRGRELGLNENLAREILELHTLGVAGGYDQADVTEFARVLTGWSIGGKVGRFQSGKPGEFEFRSLMHEPGDKQILRQRVRGNGIDEGENVLVMLASHPSTARHIATKLARHFVADEPPASLIDLLTSTYLETGGELAPVYSALIDAKESWNKPLAKFKSPDDFVISTYRALGFVPDNPQQIVGVLTQLGQRPMTPGSPAGWPDTASHWDGGDALLKRIEWASAVGRSVGDRIEPAKLAAAILGPVASDTTLASIRRAESVGQGISLLLAAAEFQRR